MVILCHRIVRRRCGVADFLRKGGLLCSERSAGLVRKGGRFSPKNATMHIQRKPGEQIEVDWAGQTAAIINDETGEIIPAYVFVAVLSYSQYAYVEAFLARDQECWIAAHVNMYRFFTGVSKLLVPDYVARNIIRLMCPS